MCAFFCTAFWKPHILPLMLLSRLFSILTHNLLELAIHDFSISALHNTATHRNTTLRTLRRLQLLWAQTLHFLHNMGCCKHFSLDYSSTNRQRWAKIYVNIPFKKPQPFKSLQALILSWWWFFIKYHVRLIIIFVFKDLGETFAKFGT